MEEASTRIQRAIELLKGLKEADSPPTADSLQPTAHNPETGTGAARLAWERSKEELRLRRLRLLGQEPTGEELSHSIGRLELIDLDKIKIDKKFVNTRIHEDVFREDLTINEGQKLEDLERSMRDEGLKIPITVGETGAGFFYLYIGFRRTKCARKLGWKRIPAVVLPANTPLQNIYWYNILENTTRKSLTSYETAMAAKTMVDRFRVPPSQFARKAGYSEAYVSKLLSCARRLPPYLMEQWKQGAGVSFDELYRLSLLEPEQAIRTFRRWTGQSASDRLKDIEKRNGGKKKLAPAKWMTRMQRLYIGIEGSEVLEIKTRQLVLKAIEVCMGQRDGIPGVYDPRNIYDYERRARLRRELTMPEAPGPGDDPQMPPPPALQIDANDE